MRVPLSVGATSEKKWLLRSLAGLGALALVPVVPAMLLGVGLPPQIHVWPGGAAFFPALATQVLFFLIGSAGLLGLIGLAICATLPMETIQANPRLRRMTVVALVYAIAGAVLLAALLFLPDRDLSSLGFIAGLAALSALSVLLVRRINQGAWS